MLSLGKIKQNGESYYLAAVADGIDEYYRNVGEAPGQWSGAAAEGLGLEGEVAPEALHALCAGLAPVTGEKLGRFAGRRVALFDLCFRAPKSVSLLAALGDPDTVAAVRDAHDASVAAAFAFVEANAGRSRTGKNGVNQVEVNGLIAAGFRHRTSRTGDPHLHTHMLVANMAQCPDGKWRTLDGRVRFHYARTAGFLYQAHLRQELTVRLGVEWLPIKDGIADLVGIDEEVRDHFSDRRKEIDEHLDKIGFRSARAAELAALETRRAKETGADGVAMWEVWEAKAAEVGFDPATLADVIGRVPARPAPIERDEILSDLVSEVGLTERASTFTRRDVLRAIAERVPAGATVAQIEDMADELFTRPHLVRLVEPGSGPGLLATTSIRRRDGTLVAGGVDETCWSTAELVATEQRLMARAVARQDRACGVVDDELVDAVWELRPMLSGEQVAMLESLTQAGHGVEVVAAAAGTGKTYTLDAARHAWESAGYRVIGAALAGIAAQELEASAAIPSTTLTLLNARLVTGETGFDVRTVIVIDEAAMAGTRLLAPVLDAADRADAKVVLVGDPRQLSEIDAGGVLRGVTSRLGPIELVENRRQQGQWERDALEQLRSGDVAVAYAEYERNGRVVTAPTAPEVRTAMVSDWWSHHLAGDDVAMMAVRRSDVDDLNGRARAYLVRAGKVSGPELVINERPYQAGDTVICLKNNRRLGVSNGTRATVACVDADRGRIVIDTVADKRVVLPAEYLEAGHIAHAYATTIHKAQGATFDRGLLLGTDELYRERGYVGMSRGRASNHLYIVGGSDLDDATGHGPRPLGADPVEAVQQALMFETDKRLAIDTGDPISNWPIEDLVAEKHRLRGILDSCPPDRTQDVRSLAARRDQLAVEVEALADRYADHSGVSVLSRTKRAEHRDIGKQLGEGTAALGRLAKELGAAREEAALRDQFEIEHADDTARLRFVERELGSAIWSRVETRVVEPPVYFLQVLGHVPAEAEALSAWRRGAFILESHQVTADSDRTRAEALTSIGGATDLVETRARLEVLSARGAESRVPRVERDMGISL